MQKIKWGVLGTAGIAKGCTIPGMQQAENCELYAIAGRDMVKAQAFKEEFGFKDLVITNIGTIIGAHTGPELISIFYLGKPRVI